MKREAFDPFFLLSWKRLVIITMVRVSLAFCGLLSPCPKIETCMCSSYLLLFHILGSASFGEGREKKICNTIITSKWKMENIDTQPRCAICSHATSVTMTQT